MKTIAETVDSGKAVGRAYSFVITRICFMFFSNNDCLKFHCFTVSSFLMKMFLYK